MKIETGEYDMITAMTLREHTAQEVFDQVYSGLRNQGFLRSVTISSTIVSCQYRGDGGRKCAAGHIISDEEIDQVSSKFDDGVEGKDWRRIALDLDTEHHCDLIQDLQGIHDENAQPSGMELALEEYATLHGLTIPSAEAAQA